MTTTFTCDLDASGSALQHVWSHTVGSGRAVLALRADWQAQLRRARAELGVRYVRFHGVLNDEMGTRCVVLGKDVFSFCNADRIIDFLLAIGMKPFVELSFMPTALATGDATVFAYKANITPPRELAKWSDLITRLARHWVDRYGADEVRAWYFEVWNEPNLAQFWSGTQADYCRLYQATAVALKGVDAAIRVGGPATAADGWVPEFLGFCDANQVPVDFVSTHHYPTDGSGKPGDDPEARLAGASRDVLIQRTRAMRETVGTRPLCYTEWSASADAFFRLQDESYAAAFLCRNALEVADLVACHGWWTFSDIFEEVYFSSVPFHGGFGLLTIHGIAKPAYRAMQLLHDLGTERLPVWGTHATVDAWAVRADASHIDLLLTNHAFPRQAIAPEAVTWHLTGLRQPVRASARRIDAEHANSRQAWIDMGSPAYPDARQLAELDEASRLSPERVAVQPAGDGCNIQLNLPPHAIAAVRVELAA